MKTVKAPAALKHLIQLRLDALPCVDEDDVRLLARDVQWHGVDEEGRNWDMSGYRGPANYGTDVRSVVDKLRREYLLQEGA